MHWGLNSCISFCMYVGSVSCVRSFANVYDSLSFAHVFCETNNSRALQIMNYLVARADARVNRVDGDNK